MDNGYKSFGVAVLFIYIFLSILKADQNQAGDYHTHNQSVLLSMDE